MHLVELSDCTIPPQGRGKGLDHVVFRLASGDVWSIHSENSDDAHLLLKVLATLARPVSGTYRFMGDVLDFSDYRNLLSVKKQIAYVASDSAMISNESIRDNLLLMRNYFENSLSLKLEAETLELCRILGIEDKLDMRPASLDVLDVRSAIFVRELMKSPKLLLLERPEDLISHTKYAGFRLVLKNLLQNNISVVFMSNDKKFVKSFSSHNLLISDGKLLEAGLWAKSTG